MSILRSKVGDMIFQNEHDIFEPQAPGCAPHDEQNILWGSGGRLQTSNFQLPQSRLHFRQSMVEFRSHARTTSGPPSGKILRKPSEGSTARDRISNPVLSW